MQPSYEIVVSTENNHYSAWQAMLFHYSCVKHTGKVPIVVVHGERESLLPGFQSIQRKGGRVQRARNFRDDGGLDYPPRNTAGSLSCVHSDADYLVLCDPDIVFFGPLPMERYRLASNQVSFDAVSYLKVQEENRHQLADVCHRAGVSLERLEQSPISGGVPHIVPAALREPLSRHWLRCMEYFAPQSPSPKQNGPQLPWLATMWALVLAVQRLDLEPIITHFCITNYEGRRSFGVASSPTVLLHYCYGDSEFDKRSYVNAQHAYEKVWRAHARHGSVNGALCAQLRAAGIYYGASGRACESRAEGDYR